MKQIDTGNRRESSFTSGLAVLGARLGAAALVSLLGACSVSDEDFNQQTSSEEAPRAREDPDNQSAFETEFAEFEGVFSLPVNGIYTWRWFECPPPPAEGCTSAILDAEGVSGSLDMTTRFLGIGARFRITLRLGPLALARNGYRYGFQVENEKGSSTSELATLEVKAAPSPPIIREQPETTEMVFGEAVTFKVRAVGIPPLTYQWFRDGIPVTGPSLSPQISLNSVRWPEDEGDYTVTVTDPLSAAVTSPQWRLQVDTPISIDVAPQNQTVAVGARARFSVAVGGAPGIRIQWFRAPRDQSLQYIAANEIPGATFDVYETLPTTLADDQAVFGVRATSANGRRTEFRQAVLTVVDGTNLPVITRHPANVAVMVGDTATFSVEAMGAMPLTYQWFRNGAEILGALGSSYSVPGVTLADNDALFSVRVLNAFGTVFSTPARLTVTPRGVAARGPTDIVSVRIDGTLGGPDSGSGGQVHALSHDGRYVAFVSSALLTGGGCGVFLRDMQMRQTRLITVRPDGNPGSLPSGGTCLNARVAMTPDARHVAFISQHADLVGRSFAPGVVSRAYVRDTCIGAPAGCIPRTTLMAVDSADVTLAGNSSAPSISDDGRYFVFEGRAPDQATSVQAAVLHDRDADGNGVYDERPSVPNPANPTFRSFAVSRQNSGSLFNLGSLPMISGNGRFVVFMGAISSPGDCTRPSGLVSLCVYVYDRDANNNGVLDETTVTGGVRTINVSVNSAGQIAQGGEVGAPWISADGRVVTFRTTASNLEATMPALFPLYIHDRDVAASGFFDTAGNVRTQVASLDAASNEVAITNIAELRGFSRRGRFVLLDGPGNWAPPNDPNASNHLYLRDTCVGAAAPSGCIPTTVRLSVRSDGTVPDAGTSTYYGALSGDGRRVVFSQSGGGLIDLNGDTVREEHSNREVYYGATGTGEP